MDRLIEKIAEGETPSLEETVRLLELRGEKAESLRRAAREVKHRTLGNRVFLRGLIEFSNICRCDCLYCGIRKSNVHVERYDFSDGEILDAARFAFLHGYGAVVLQSGERRDDAFTRRVGRIVHEIKTRFPPLGVTLSCGEESIDVYRAWRAAGAERYLLRIETSDEKLFGAIHDGRTRFKAREKALDDLREAGFTVGSGVMIGIPGQSTSDLARDLAFFRGKDLDMIGMGPYLSHPDAPMGKIDRDTPEKKRDRLELSLNMIALVRLTMRDVNIAAATALQAIDPARGRIRGIAAGANVLMPNTGNAAFRKNYFLYENKPLEDETSPAASEQLRDSLREIGEEIVFGDSGTPLHYLRRTGGISSV